LPFHELGWGRKKLLPCGAGRQSLINSARKKGKKKNNFQGNLLNLPEPRGQRSLGEIWLRPGRPGSGFPASWGLPMGGACRVENNSDGYGKIFLSDLAGDRFNF